MNNIATSSRGRRFKGGLIASNAAISAGKICTPISIKSTATKRVTGVRSRGTLELLHTPTPKNSLLNQVLEGADGKFFSNQLYTYLRFLVDGLNNSRTLSIYETPIDELSPDDLFILWDYTEDFIDNSSIEKKLVTSSGYRRFLSMCLGAISNGDEISSLVYQYKSRFKTADRLPQPRNVISELPDAYFNAPELAAPVSALRFDRWEEVNEKMLRHFEARNNRTEEVLVAVVEEFLHWRNLLVSLREESIDVTLTEKILDQFTSNPFDCCYFENGNHRKDPFSQFFHKCTDREYLILMLRIVDHFQLGTLEGQEEFVKNDRRLYKINEKSGSLKPQLGRGSISSWAILLLLDRFVDCYTLIAIQSLIQLWFGYNADTVRNMKECDVKRTKDGRKIILTPIKHKVGKQQPPVEIDIRKEPFRAAVIELLLDNHKNTCDFSGRQESLIIGPMVSQDEIGSRRRKELYRPICFAKINWTRHLKFMLSRAGHPLFTPEQLRDQAICTRLLKSGNPYEAMAMAGHKSLSTLIFYANQRVFKIANQINIHEFQRQLNDSILWSVRSTKDLAKHGIDAAKVNKSLFFPVSDSGHENIMPEVDLWLDAMKKNERKKVVLTVERIVWCLTQHNYYTSRIDALHSKNPERFRKVHLPRIVFCSVLLAIIKDQRPSYFKRALSELEQEIRGI